MHTDMSEKEINELIKKIDGNEHVIKVLKNKLNDATIYLVGCSHISEKSSKTVIDVLNIVKPDTVFLELSEERKHFLKFTDEQVNAALGRTPRVHWFGKDLSTFLLTIVSTYYHYSSKIFNYVSGNEMRVAYDYARANKCTVVLGDRNQLQSWRKSMNSIDGKTLLKIYGAIYSGASFINEASEKEIIQKFSEDLEHSDDVNGEWETDIVKDYPNIFHILVNERDQFMASTLRDSPGKVIVGVVGRAHLPGISRHVNDPIEGFKLRAELEEVGSSTFISKYGLPISLATGLTVPASITMGSIYAIRNRIFSKPMKPSMFITGFIGCMGLELVLANNYVNGILQKMDKLSIN